MPREDDIETVVPVRPQSSTPDFRASISGAEVTLPGHVEFTTPGGQREPSPHRTAPRPGDTIGTFVVERQLGHGAMGIVLLALDPELDRHVAIKLLAVDDRDPTASTRLLREAQSAAGISHPNVVAIHQVGTHDGQVYVVMEFVDGGTLHEWVDQTARSWQEILAVYLQAGEGLAAAHRLGFVHRDFKPDNVLIGSDGRVRVSDFGLVGRSGDVQLATTMRSFDGIADRLTQTGAIMGTPAYMPPEQLSGDRVDARSDQFSFCVALFEALWGRRPYPGDTLASIFAAIDAGEIEPPPPDDVPPAVRAAVLRGLAAAPENRHANVDALLVALRAHALQPRRRAPFVVAAVALLGVGAAGSYLAAPSTVPAEVFSCPDAAAGYGEAWSPKRRDAVQAAFAKRPTGAANFVVLDAELTARRDEWLQAHEAACEARRSGQQSDVTFALRQQCLAARQTEADLFSELLTGTDDRLLDGALSSSTTLLPIDACQDVEALQAAPEPTPSQAEQLVPLRRELARARILLLAGRHTEVADLLQPLIPQLREVDYAADLASGLEIQARVQMQLAQYELAEANLREALTLAAQARDHGTEARATGTLIFVVGERQKRYDEALGMLPAGRAAAARSPDPRALSYLEAAIATLFVGQERYDEARTAMDRVIDTLEGLPRPPADELANAYSNRADLRTRMGDPDGAVEDHQRAVAVAEAGLGKMHPFYGAFAVRLGLTLQARGLNDGALLAYRNALSAWEATYGPDHTSCALALLYIGILQREMGDLAAAVISMQDGIGRNERAEGKDPRGLISLIDNLAYVQVEQGEWTAAWDGYVRARNLIAEAGGEHDPRLPTYDSNLASVLSSQGKYAEALPYLERARTQLVGQHGPKHPEVATASRVLGDLYSMLDDCASARGHYGSALRTRAELSLPADASLANLLAGSGECDVIDGDLQTGREAIQTASGLAEGSGDARLLARIEFAQARLARRDGDHATADRLARMALRRFEALGPTAAHRVGTIEAWLRSTPPHTSDTSVHRAPR